MGDEPASWVVAGDQVVITLTGVDIAKIRWEICRKEKYIQSSICTCAVTKVSLRCVQRFHNFDFFLDQRHELLNS